MGFAAPQLVTSFAFNVVLLMHGLPLFAPFRQTASLNAPFCDAVCPGQKRLQLPWPAAVQHVCGEPEPVHRLLSNGVVRLEVPVVSGFRLIGMLPMNCAHDAPAQFELVEQVSSLFGPP